MFILFLALTGLSVVALIVGTVWTAVVFGQTRRRSGPEVGAEIMAERMARSGGCAGLGSVSAGWVRLP